MIKIHPTAIIEDDVKFIEHSNHRSSMRNKVIVSFVIFIISNIVCLFVSSDKSPIVIIAKSFFLFIPAHLIFRIIPNILQDIYEFKKTKRADEIITVFLGSLGIIFLLYIMAAFIQNQ